MSLCYNVNYLARCSVRIVVPVPGMAIHLDWTTSRKTQKIYLLANCKGNDSSEITDGKLLARRIQICFDYFCLGIILGVIQYNFQIMPKQK